MTIYVDDLRYPARDHMIAARWSHLLVAPSADLVELHAFAASIGLPRTWFQDEWPLPHYDVTETKRQQAIAAGAVPITCRETGEFVRQAIARDRG